MEIKGRKIEELKHIAQTQIEEYKEIMKQIDENHPIQYWPNQDMKDEYQEKIEVLESLIEMIDNFNLQKEN